MFTLPKALIVSVAMVGLTSVSHASQIVQTASTGTPAGSYSATDFDFGLTLNKFNVANATLNSVDFLLTGNVVGDIRLESLDAQARTLTSRLRATIMLERPDGSSIVVTTPIASFADNATSYDGTTDYGGTSGFSHLNVSASNFNALLNDTSATDLALFTGPGTITLIVDASGASAASGAGNLQTNFRTTGEANIQVNYNYTSTTSVPEPASMTLLGFGVIGVGMLRFRRWA